MTTQIAPATIEGWFALHQMYRSPHAADIRQPADERGGWSRRYALVGGGGSMLIHFRSTLEELAEIPVNEGLTYHFLSVTEAGLYHATSEAVKEHPVGSDALRSALEEASHRERESAHVRSRLYPQVPEAMKYACFYPMNKRRGEQHNWYALPIAERSLLMRDHGMVGRRYSGRVFQVITGAVGFADWEWGVTLFASDPLDFKRLVTEMRYDPASALYGEFGPFYVGIEAPK